MRALRNKTTGELVEMWDELRAEPVPTEGFEVMEDGRWSRDGLYRAAYELLGEPPARILLDDSGELRAEPPPLPPPPETPLDPLAKLLEGKSPMASVRVSDVLRAAEEMRRASEV
jgi:hypothetical protein